MLEGCVNGSGKERVLEGTEEENGEECGGDARKGDKKIHAQKNHCVRQWRRILFFSSFTPHKIVSHDFAYFIILIEYFFPNEEICDLALYR